MKRLMVLSALAVISVNLFAADKGIGRSTMQTEQTSQDKNFNFRIEPQWLILKELVADFQFKIAPNFTLGPTLGFMNNGEGVYAGTSVAKRSFFDDRTDRQTYGLRGVYYISGANVSSVYISGFGRYSNVKVTSSPNSILVTDTRRSGRFTETSYGLTAGYQWNLRFLTFNAGGGFGNYNHPGKVDLKGSDGTVDTYDIANGSSGFVLDAGMGFTF